MQIKDHWPEDYAKAVLYSEDRWVAACGGAEVPCEYQGTSYLYVFNAATREHGYLNMSTDIVSPEAPWAPFEKF